MATEMFEVWGPGNSGDLLELKAGAKCWSEATHLLKWFLLKPTLLPKTILCMPTDMCGPPSLRRAEVRPAEWSFLGVVRASQRHKPKQTTENAALAKLGA